MGDSIEQDWKALLTPPGDSEPYVANVFDSTEQPVRQTLLQTQTFVESMIARAKPKKEKKVSKYQPKRTKKEASYNIFF